MKNIIFYGRTQVGSAVLSYLVAKGYSVKVIAEDEIIRDLCRFYNLETVTLDNMGLFSLFICCHGSKIIDEKYLVDKKFINMHPCLWKYKGKDPISRYIQNGDTEASIESHYLIKEVDSGEVIKRITFTTPVIKTHGEFFNIALPYYYKCIDETMSELQSRRASLRNSAMTRFSGNLQRLEQWLVYYSKYFDDLYVMGFYEGSKETEDISPLVDKYKFNFTKFPYDIYSVEAHQTVFAKQKELLKTGNWVFYSDLDEFVVSDPREYTDLKDFMAKSREDQTFCEGYNVYKNGSEQDIDYRSPVLSQREYWYKDNSGSYNKPLLSRIESQWAMGFHKLTSMSDEDIKKVRDTGLYLVHLKHINEEPPQEGGDIHRTEVPKYFKQLL